MESSMGSTARGMIRPPSTSPSTWPSRPTKPLVQWSAMPALPPALTIDTEGLRKTFGTRPAVRDLTLQIGRGEAFGFLGPNGAGKSTSIKMLLGLVKPTGGRANLLGRPVGTRE